MQQELGRPVDEAFAPMENLSVAVAAFKRCWPVLFVGGCIKSCTQGGGGGGNSFSDMASDPNLSEDMRLVMAGVGLVMALVVLGVALVLLLVRAWLIPGWLRVHEEILRTGGSDWSTLFSGGDRFLPMLGWSILSGVLLFFVVVLAGAPGIGALVWGVSKDNVPLMVGGGLLAAAMVLPVVIYVRLGMNFGDYLIVFDERGVFETLGEAWTLAAGTRISQLILGVVLAGVGFVALIAGFAMCCVGLWVTMPISIAIGDFARTRATLLYLRPRTETEAWFALA